VIFAEKTDMSREEKREMMVSLVQQWQESGMTQKDFAETHGIKLSTLQYWIRKKRKGSSHPSFIPLDISTGHSIRLYYPNGIEMELPSGTPVNVIRHLISL